MCVMAEWREGRALGQESTLLQIFQVSNKDCPCDIGGNRIIKKGGLEKHSQG